MVLTIIFNNIPASKKMLPLIYDQEQDIITHMGWSHSVKFSQFGNGPSEKVSRAPVEYMKVIGIDTKLDQLKLTDTTLTIAKSYRHDTMVRRSLPVSTNWNHLILAATNQTTHSELSQFRFVCVWCMFLCEWGCTGRIKYWHNLHNRMIKMSNWKQTRRVNIFFNGNACLYVS